MNGCSGDLGSMIATLEEDIHKTNIKIENMEAAHRRATDGPVEADVQYCREHEARLYTKLQLLMKEKALLIHRQGTHEHSLTSVLAWLYLLSLIFCSSSDGGLALSYQAARPILGLSLAERVHLWAHHRACDALFRSSACFA